jgi:hypothetical protein
MADILWGTYSFQNFSAAITGPGGSFVIAGPETATAEEGMTVTWGEEANTQTIGADGAVMNSLHASKAGTAAVRLQKISPVNALLGQMFVFQRLSSLTWALNIITLRDSVTGDNYTLTGCAFTRFPTNSWAKVGNMLEWELQVAIIDPLLGTGQLALAS